MNIINDQVDLTERLRRIKSAHDYLMENCRSYRNTHTKEDNKKMQRMRNARTRTGKEQ